MRPYQRPGRTPCSIAGCRRGLYCLSLCTMHYTRLKKRGDLGPAEPLIRPRGTGSIIPDGYLVIGDPSHPLAGAQGKVRRNRVVLYASLGPGEHPCHWCGVLLPWQGNPSHRINADHLDDNRLNDSPENLVAACLDCNTKRGRGLLVAVTA